MLKIEYNEWIELCNNLKKYIIAYRKFYLQLYPITEEILEKIKEENYFNKYIKTGAFLWDDINRNNYEKIMKNKKYNDDIHKICQLRNKNMVNHAAGNNNDISIL